MDVQARQTKRNKFSFPLGVTRDNLYSNTNMVGRVLPTICSKERSRAEPLGTLMGRATLASWACVISQLRCAYLNLRFSCRPPARHKLNFSPLVEMALSQRRSVRSNFPRHMGRGGSPFGRGKSLFRLDLFVPEEKNREKCLETQTRAVCLNKQPLAKRHGKCTPWKIQA